MRAAVYQEVSSLIDFLRESFSGEAGKRFTLTKKHSRQKSNAQMGSKMGGCKKNPPNL